MIANINATLDLIETALEESLSDKEARAEADLNCFKESFRATTPQEVAKGESAVLV